MTYPSNRDEKKDWFRAVMRDPDQLADALLFFDEQYKEAMELATLEGRIMDANKFHPGHMARFGFYAVQLKRLAEIYDIKTKRVRGKVIEDWDKNPPTQRKWGATDIKLMIENEPAVIEADAIYQEVQYAADKWMEFANEFRSRSFRIGDAVRLVASNNADAEFERDY